MVRKISLASLLQSSKWSLFCVLFPPIDFASGKGGHQPLGGLVMKPYRNLKDALENFRAHEVKGYHKSAVLRSESICDIVDQKKDSVIHQLDKKRKQDVLNNIKKLIPVIIN